jgi:hypothetical protein
MSLISTFLCSDSDELSQIYPQSSDSNPDAVVLLSLGLPIDSFLSFAKNIPPNTALFLADCYGILGFSQKAKKNIELMESGRGSEYGGEGGDGGEGITFVSFSGGNHIASVDSLPGDNITAHMAVGSNGGINSFLNKNISAVYFGGIAKATYQYDSKNEKFNSVPYFFISFKDIPVGATSFTSDAKEPMTKLIRMVPKGGKIESVALFPCFMRGKNKYGKNNVEPDIVSDLLPGIPIYGMFSHGELGPNECVGFTKIQNPAQNCSQHSMTTVAAIHVR